VDPLADRAACRRLSAAASDVPTCLVTARWAAKRADCNRRMVSIPTLPDHWALSGRITPQAELPQLCDSISNDSIPIPTP